jgi:hypothetical protein
MMHDRDQTEMWDAVISALAEEGASARHDTTVPSASIVWWRAQMRARQEAARTAARPMVVAHWLALACATGFALGVAGIAFAWLRGAASALFGWSTEFASIAAGAAETDLASRWIATPLGLLLAMALLAPVAVYLITADD